MIAACETCGWWHQGAPGLASGHADAHSDAEYGACQLDPPVVVPIEVANAERRVATCAAAFFPVTHCSRSCRDWCPRPDPDDDDGERVDAPSTVVPFVPSAVAA